MYTVERLKTGHEVRVPKIHGGRDTRLIAVPLRDGEPTGSAFGPYRTLGSLKSAMSRKLRSAARTWGGYDPDTYSFAVVVLR